ncbi:hypothetical protein NW760_012644 [Fusarium oxysporum]|nr:hypothetical protein NW760_012644 [Fusarium oxysporum]
MAEVLGIAASVIAVVDLLAKVVSLCSQYSDQVNARDDIEQLSEAIVALETTTKKMLTYILGRRGMDPEASQQLRSVMRKSHSRFERLKQQLQPSNSLKITGSSDLPVIDWQFTREDVEETVRGLERCRRRIDTSRIELDQLPIAHGASLDSQAEGYSLICSTNAYQEVLENIKR